MSLLLLSDSPPLGADISFNGPMLALPYSLQRLGFTYTRNSPKTVYQNGSLVTLSANQFGTTYDSVTGLHAFEAEPAATNLALNSAGAAATWTVSNVTDAGTPISGFAASLAFGDNSVQRSATKPISVTDAATYSISVFVEMDDASAPTVGAANNSGDLSITLNGVIATAKLLVKRIGTGNLYRISGSIVASATASHPAGFTKYVGQSAKSFRIVGIQVETGSRATSYIATAGATVTRAADVLSTATANLPGFSAAGYTLSVDFRRDIDTLPATRHLASVSDGTANNRQYIRQDGGGTAIVYAALTGGVSQAGVTIALAGTSRAKAAHSVATNSFLCALNGAAGTADVSGTIPAATLLTIGCGFNTADQYNGFIYGFKLIPVALNQAQTTALTS